MAGVVSECHTVAGATTRVSSRRTYDTVETVRATARSTPAATNQRAPLRDQVVSDVRRLILENTLQPGQPLREEHLAQLLGVSRGPIREALIELEREGLAQRRPGRSTVVTEYQRRDLEEVYSLRRAQEAVATRAAIRVASGLEAAELQAKAELFGEACAAGAPQEELASLDIDFHDHLYRIARHERLYVTWLMIRTQVFIFLRARTGVTEDMRTRAHLGHLEIAAAHIARDEGRALEAADRHLTEAYTRSIASLPDWLLEDDRPLPLASPPALR
jgi:DNA-binding GntR family transcriptional regulator